MQAQLSIKNMDDNEESSTLCVNNPALWTLVGRNAVKWFYTPTNAASEVSCVLSGNSKLSRREGRKAYFGNVNIVIYMYIL